MARRHQLHILTILTAIWLVWVVWFMVTGRVDAQIRVVDEDGQPVVGAVVSRQGDEVARTDAQGEADFRWSRGVETLDVTAPGFLPGWVPVTSRPDATVIARIDARLLRGRVTDPAGRPVSGVYVSSGFGESVTSRDGHFEVRMAEPGTVSVWRPAWHPGDFEWDGSPGEGTLAIEPVLIKAVHVSGEAAGDAVRWAELVDLADRTELNAVMLDLKDEAGTVYYQTEVETASQAGAIHPAYDLAEVAGELADRELYLIGRIVTFQDPIAARRLPAMAVTVAGSGEPYTNNDQYFLDPTDLAARSYAIDLAEEACRLGVDEIQFDYLRYPDGFGESAVFDGGATEDVRVEAIRSFLIEARERLHEHGCAVAGDIFGFVTTATNDGGIGQQWEVVTQVLDVVSPMLYPSHYDPGWYGFELPSDHPGEMVTRALQDGVDRLEGGAVVRPWLQDFAYDADQVRAQIEASETFGFGWMLWNADSNVSEEALQPAPD